MRISRLIATISIAAFAAAAGKAVADAPADPAQLRTVVASPATGETVAAFDGVVQAVREAAIASQVSGTVIELAVEEGDRVEAGQVLLRIDARLADRRAAASDAQLQVEDAALALAKSDLERQRRLYAQGYISRAALESAESTLSSAQARVDALGAQAKAARIESGYHVLRAPFAGVVSEVPASRGDMVMPGRTLVALYDPFALRVVVAVPQTVAARLGSAIAGSLEFQAPGRASLRVAPASMQLLPTVDAATHTASLRIALPPGQVGIVPGMFARLRLSLPGTGDTALGALAGATLSVPASAIVRRAELTGLYVVDSGGRPILRQVRLGRSVGDRIEVLSGLMAGERVALDPLVAARWRQAAP